MNMKGTSLRTLWVGFTLIIILHGEYCTVRERFRGRADLASLHYQGVPSAVKDK